LTALSAIFETPHFLERLQIATRHGSADFRRFFEVGRQRAIAVFAPHLQQDDWWLQAVLKRPSIGFEISHFLECL
jgi:hypothetical protein